MQWLGMEGQRVADAELVGLFFTRPGLFWIALAVALPVMVWVVWRQRRALAGRSRWVAWLLAATRCGLLLAAVVLLGGPALRYEAAVEDRPIAAVLIDTSASMALPLGGLDDSEVINWARATGGEPPEEGDKNYRWAFKRTKESLKGLTRAQATRLMIDQQLRPLRDALDDSVELRVYLFNQDTQAVPVAEAAVAMNQPGDTETLPQGSELLATLERVGRDAAGRPIAGVLVVGDGRWTGSGGLTQQLDPRTGRGELAGLRVWTLPTGGRTPPADMWIEDVIAPPRVSVGEDAAVVVTVGGVNLPEGALTLELRRGAEVLDTRTIDRHDRGRPQELTFTPTRLGVERLEVRVLPFEGERAVANNTRPVRVMVDDRRLKLLYLDGSSSWDFRFLNRALRRDPGVEVQTRSAWPLRAAGVLPADLADRMGVPDTADEFAAYDAVLLGDVSAPVLPEARQRALLRAVRERGVGLVLHCGPTGLPADFVASPLAQAFPTRLSIASRQPIEPDGAWALSLSVTAAGAAHPAFRLSGDAARTRAVWRQMPGFFWAARLGEPRPGAQVLARAVDPRGREVPLIVAHTLERGRVVAVGTDATYRWRHNRGDTIFYRFWGQLLRTAARDSDPTDKTWLRAGPLVADVGEPVTVELFSRPAVSQPRGSATVWVRGEGMDEPTKLRLRATDAPGRFSAAWVPQSSGTLTLEHDDGQGTTASAQVEVYPSDGEFDRIDVDRPGMASLAETTGGGLLEPDELPAWADRLDPTFTAASERFERPAWDHWLTLLLITLVYSVDITARRLNGMQ